MILGIIIEYDFKILRIVLYKNVIYYLLLFEYCCVAVVDSKERYVIDSAQEDPHSVVSPQS